MKHPITIYAPVLIAFFLTACDSTESTGSDGTNDPVTFDNDFNGVANGTLTVGGKAFPIEFIALAYSKKVTLTGFTDLAHQDTGWHVILSASASSTSPQDLGGFTTTASLAYRPKKDSVDCVYDGKSGTLAIESFAAKKSGTTSFFRTSGKGSFTGNKNRNNSVGVCPTLAFEVTFSQVDTEDGGLNQ